LKFFSTLFLRINVFNQQWFNEQAIQQKEKNWILKNSRQIVLKLMNALPITE
jgi:hypothetical protein